MYTWDVLKDNVKEAKILWTITEPCLNREFQREELKNFHTLRIFVFLRGLVTWKVMPRNVWNDIVSWRTERLNNSTKYQFLALTTIISKKKNWTQLENCQKYALKLFKKCLYLARIGRPDILWSVNKLALSMTKWTKACDKRLSRLISYIHHTCEYKQYCHVGNTSKQSRIGLFQDSEFTRDLEDSKSTSGGTLCIFGSHTFVPISWMCKKQTSVSHSSTESEIISLDAALRLDGIHALVFWDLIVAVLHGNTYQKDQERGDPYKCPTRKKIHGKNDDLDNADFISSTETWDMFPGPTELLLIGCLIESICTPRSKSNTSTPGTNSQTYWPREISHVMNGIIFCACLTLAISVLPLVLKWCRKECKKDSGEERVTAKSKPMMNLVLTIQRKGSERACLDCIGKPRENEIWKSERTSELV